MEMQPIKTQELHSFLERAGKELLGQHFVGDIESIMQKISKTVGSWVCAKCQSSNITITPVIQDSIEGFSLICGDCGWSRHISALELLQSSLNFPLFSDDQKQKLDAYIGSRTMGIEDEKEKFEAVQKAIREFWESEERKSLGVTTGNAMSIETPLSDVGVVCGGMKTNQENVEIVGNAMSIETPLSDVGVVGGFAKDITETVKFVDDSGNEVPHNHAFKEGEKINVEFKEPPSFDKEIKMIEMEKEIRDREIFSELKSEGEEKDMDFKDRMSLKVLYWRVQQLHHNNEFIEKLIDENAYKEIIIDDFDKEKESQLKKHREELEKISSGVQKQNQIILDLRKEKINLVETITVLENTVEYWRKELGKDKEYSDKLKTQNMKLERQNENLSQQITSKETDIKKAKMHNQNQKEIIEKLTEENRFLKKAIDQQNKDKESMDKLEKSKPFKI